MQVNKTKTRVEVRWRRRGAMDKYVGRFSSLSRSQWSAFNTTVNKQFVFSDRNSPKPQKLSLSPVTGRCVQAH